MVRKPRYGDEGEVGNETPKTKAPMKKAAPVKPKGKGNPLMTGKLKQMEKGKKK